MKESNPKNQESKILPSLLVRILYADNQPGEVEVTSMLEIRQYRVGEYTVKYGYFTDRFIYPRKYGIGEARAR